MVDEKTVPFPIFVARLVLLTVLVVASIIVVDIIALLFLNLVTDIGMWLKILLLESVILMIIGAGGARQRMPYRDARGGWRKEPQTIKHGLLASTDFWISLAIAGTVLLISAVYLVSQYY